MDKFSVVWSGPEPTERVETAYEWVSDGSRVPKAGSLTLAVQVTASERFGLGAALSPHAADAAAAARAPSCRYRRQILRACRLFRDTDSPYAASRHAPLLVSWTTTHSPALDSVTESSVTVAGS